MNIFVLDKNPKKAARMLCDCHLRKMCVETAQILSGVMLRRGIPLLDGMPKPQNINHPVIVAAEATQEATKWTVDYNDFLYLEYRYRFDKEHALFHIAAEYQEFLTQIEVCKSDYCTHLAKCCGDLDVANLDIVTAYRKYYTEVKKTQLAAKNLWKFTNREDWTANFERKN